VGHSPKNFFLMSACGCSFGMARDAAFLRQGDRTLKKEAPVRLSTGTRERTVWLKNHLWY